MVSSSSKFKFTILSKGPRGVCGPSPSHLIPSLAILVPTCCKEVPNLTPRSPKRAQLMAKIAQDPKMWPKRCSVVRFYTSTIFLNIAPKTTKNAQKSSPNGFKMAILAPTWPQDGHLGPNLEDLGAILAPTWPHLGPIWRDFGRSEPGQN